MRDAFGIDDDRDDLAVGFGKELFQKHPEVVDFVLDHHPDIVGEHVRWTGKVLVKPAPVGGDRGDTEETLPVSKPGEPLPGWLLEDDWPRPEVLDAILANDRHAIPGHYAG